MKHLQAKKIIKFFIPLFVIICCQLPSVGQQRIISLLDFGAISNDSFSDQDAFNKAADFINKNKGNVKLLIPAGSYIVGPGYNFQGSLSSIPLGKLWDVLAIYDCKDVTITGIGKVNIKFLDHIPVGTITQTVKDKDSSVHIGSFLRLTRCSNIAISNLDLNGNGDKMRLLKNWGVGGNPYEREHDGLMILNSANVQVSNVSFHHFIRDGAMVLENQGELPVANIDFFNCKFDNNGRNGFSWCGGKGIRFNHCSFNYNATGKVNTNPASGLDIEPERGADCEDGIFLNCEFINNSGYGVASMYSNSRNVIFDSCNIIGGNNYSFVSSSPRFIITNSSVAGTALFLYDAKTIEDGFKVINSTFTDSIKGKKVYRDNYLAAIKGRFTSFTGCIFTGFIVPSVYTEITKKDGLSAPENTLFKNCIFKALFVKPSTWNTWPLLTSNSSFQNCEFQTAGFADFNNFLQQPGKNNYQRNNRHTRRFNN